LNLLFPFRDGSASPTYFIDPENGKPVEVPYFQRGTAENSSEEDLKLRNMQVGFILRLYQA